MKSTMQPRRAGQHFVAPFAGAWIEMLSPSIVSSIDMSLPSRERGLKSCQFSMSLNLRESLPSRERGLKFIMPVLFFETEILSLPSRERGLKSSFAAISTPSLDVAPFAGAWIEISMTQAEKAMLRSLPSRERGLKSSFAAISTPSLGRSLRGSVD